MIVRLERAGVTLRAQGGHCDVVEGTVRYWKQGGEPKHSEGELLLDLYTSNLPDDSIPLRKA